jgi:hypothetical protein
MTILAKLFHGVVMSLEDNDTIKFITGNAPALLESFKACLEAVVTGENPNDYVYLASFVIAANAKTSVLMGQIKETDDPDKVEWLVAEYVGSIRSSIRDFIDNLKIEQ